MAHSPNPAGAGENAGPSAWAGPLVGAAFLAGLGGGIARSTYPYPRPGSSPQQIEDYFGQPSRSPWVSITGQYLSAAALTVWTTQDVGLAAGQRAPRLAGMICGGVGPPSL
jgi:hypothetical protein